MKKVLVTGAAGFIAAFLLARVYCIARKKPGKKTLPFGKELVALTQT